MMETTGAEIEWLRSVIQKNATAIDDWLNTIASELCDANRVDETRSRIKSAGGTLAYIASVQQANREALNVHR